MKYKKCLFIASAISMASHSHAAPAYAGDWSKTRLYGHASSNSGFTNTQYNWIRDNFEYFTIEKTHNHNGYGGSPAHEASCRGTAANLIAKNANCKPLMIYSCKTGYPTLFESQETALNSTPYYFYADSSTASGWRLDISNWRVRTWWKNVVNSNISSSELDGVFVDGVIKAYLGGELSDAETMMDQVNGFVLFNGFDLSQNGTFLYEGISTLNHADGVFIESFFRSLCKNSTGAKTLIDEMLDVPDNKMMVCNSSVDTGVWGRDHTFSHRAYLIAANDNTYYRWAGASGGWGVNEMMFWHTDLGRDIGEPLSDAVRIGNVYTRKFEHCTISIDVLRKTSSASWNQNNAIGSYAVLEAESATITSGTTKSKSDSSRNKYVDGSGGFKLVWNVSATSGTKNLHFRIKSPSGRRSMGVYVNGRKAGNITTSLNFWNDKKNVSASFNSGNNTIELRDSNRTSELDVDFLIVQ